MKRETIMVIENHFTHPVPPVAPGDIYTFVCDMGTRSGYTHVAGSVVTVQNGTKETPYGEISASGTNWICQTKFGTSCWSTLEQCISRGLLNKIYPAP